MYISEHVVHIRQQLTTVGRVHKSTFFSLFFRQRRRTSLCACIEKMHAKECTKGQASVQSVRSFIRIVVPNGYCRPLPPKFVLLCLYFLHYDVRTISAKSISFFRLHGELSLSFFLFFVCFCFQYYLHAALCTFLYC